MATHSQTIRVCAAQMPARPLEQARQALIDIDQAVQAARRANAQLVVLPECCYPCYDLGSKDRYLQADILRGEALEAFFADLARQHGIHIVAGLVCQQDGRLYDAAVSITPAGQVSGRHFKTFLWDREHDWYEPGEQVRPIDTPAGRIGMLICAEGRSPEVFASHRVQQAGLLAMPTAWVNAAGAPGQYYNPQPDFLVQARAVEFGLPMVCANKFGRENDRTQFCGMSLIVAPDGKVLSKAPADQPALLTAEVQIEPKPAALDPVWLRRLQESQPRRPSLAAKPEGFLLLPGDCLEAAEGPRQMRQIFADLAGSQVCVALSYSRASQRTLMAQHAAAAAGVRLVTPLETGGLVRANYATVGCMTTSQLRSFVLPRVLAMQGAQILCAFGPLIEEALLRVRAVENRVFVLAVSQDECEAVAPDGSVLARQQANDTQPLIVGLDVAQAADKLVARGTDVWMERRPEAYCLSLEDDSDGDPSLQSG